ncbi:MAG: 16S rRNA (cytidine(1402)-2'-O)-methyltransferase [Flavobacteriaceae bacterium]
MSKLFLIPTPIGNLADITVRSISILSEVDYVLCEDTRRTAKLINHLNIKKNLKSFHKFNEHSKIKNIIDDLKKGLTIGIVSDAGSPGISDPGYLIVKNCLDNNIEVESLPGPTALIPAIVISGIPCERFTFEGFLPVKKGRKKRLEDLSGEIRTMVFYESPHKISKTLNDLKIYLGEHRKVSVSKELTKIYESTIRGTLGSISLGEGKVRGEFVIVVEGLK